MRPLSSVGTFAGLGLLACLAPRTARGEGAVPAEISFGEARSVASRAAPDVRLGQGREAVAEAQVQAAGALGNPLLTVTSARETARLSTGLSLPLPLFGQRSTAVGAAQAEARTARADTEALRHEARWAATVAWLDLWESGERARLLAGAAADAARLAGIAEERFAAGSAPRVDVLRTAADRARARADAAAAAAEVPAAGARLAVALGAATDGASLRARGRPGFPAALPALAALEGALPAHPALRRDRAAVAAAESRVRLERRLRWPVINAELTVNAYDPTLPATDVIGGLSLEAPVLSLRAGAIARARAEQTLAETAAEIGVRRLRAQVHDAHRRAGGEGQRATALRTEVVPALEEVRRMTEEGYRDGRVDLVRLLEAQRALLDSRAAAVGAEAAAQRALADLERFAGVTLDGSGAGAP